MKELTKSKRVNDGVRLNNSLQVCKNAFTCEFYFIENTTVLLTMSFLLHFSHFVNPITSRSEFECSNVVL